MTAKEGKIKTTNSYIPSASLNHKLPGEMGGWLGLQGTDVDALIQRVTGHDLPVVENWQAESLALGVCSQVCLEAKRVDCWQESFDSVQRGTRHRGILGHMTSGNSEHLIGQ